MRLPPTTLAQRISALAVGVAVITALLAGVLAINLVHRSNTAAARDTLGDFADVARVAADQGSNVRDNQARVRASLRTLGIQSASIDSAGNVSHQQPGAAGGADRGRCPHGAGQRIAVGPAADPGTAGADRGAGHPDRRHRAGAAALGGHRGR